MSKSNPPSPGPGPGPDPPSDDDADGDEHDGPLIEAATLSGATVTIYDHPTVPMNGAIIDVSSETIDTQLRAHTVLIDGTEHQPAPDGTPLVLEEVEITYYPEPKRAEIGW